MPESENEARSSSAGKRLSIGAESEPLDFEVTRILHKFDDREYRARRDTALRLYVLLLVSSAGIFLVGVAAYLAITGLADQTTLMIFLASGVFLLVLAVTATLGVGTFKQSRGEQESKGAPRKTFFDELDSE